MLIHSFVPLVKYKTDTDRLLAWFINKLIKRSVAYALGYYEVLKRIYVTFEENMQIPNSYANPRGLRSNP